MYIIKPAQSLILKSLTFRTPISIIYFILRFSTNFFLNCINKVKKTSLVSITTTKCFITMLGKTTCFFNYMTQHFKRLG